MKRRELYPRLVRWSCEGPGLRQAARNYEVSHSTVQRHLARAGRAALVFQSVQRRGHRIVEPVVIDGFESFEYSQYFPYHLNLAVGAESWFVYGLTDSPLRRKGRMTAAQKRRRAALEAFLGRPDPRAVEEGVVALLRGLLASGEAPDPPLSRFLLRSDDHPAYRRARRRVEGSLGVRIEHQITSSRARRTRGNPLFPVNLADLLLRHGQANHRRETIAFSKRRQGAISRAALFLFWRNYVKRRRENRGG